MSVDESKTVAVRNKNTTVAVSKPRSKKLNGDGTITKRADGRWMIRWTERGERKVAYAKNPKEAKLKLREVVKRLEENKPSIDSGKKFSIFSEDWRTKVLPYARDRRGRELSARTKLLYGDVVRLHVAPVLKDLALADITEADVELVLNTMAAKGHSGSYQATAHKAMARMFRDAKKQRLLAVIPMVEVASPEEVPKPKIVPTSEQIRELLDSTQDQRLRTFIAGLAFTGLRISELLGAKWVDLDEDMTALDVIGKGNRPRTVPIAPALKKELIAWAQVQRKERLASPWWDEEGGWMLSSDCGTRWDTHNARARFKPLSDAVLPGMTPHSLRHATATMLLEEKVPMKVVAELLGHSSTRVTDQTYSHVTAQLVTETTDALERRLSGDAKIV